MRSKGALRIALGYLLFGTVWVAGTDWLWSRAGNAGLLSQTMEELVFVLAGALLLYAFAARWARERELTLEDRAQLERRLAVCSKFEAVGQLTSGIAHDFNNLLTAISGNLAAFSAELDGGEMPEELREASRAAERAAVLTRQLLAFGGGERARPRRVNVNEVVRNMASLLNRLIDNRVVIRTELMSEMPMVWVDPGQLEQVVMNLSINARDAMPEGGEVRVRTSPVCIDAAEAACFPFPFLPGDYVRTEVTDTGVGMTPAMQSRIFEPFFTTKPQGVGTGLGLATVYAVVKQARGYITVDSEPGRGATFQVYLPQAPEPQAADPRQESRPELRKEGAATETVLVAEDDPAVRSLMMRVLQRRGFSVTGARNGREALDLVHRAGPFEILVTDAVMPEMSGAELIDAAQAAVPGLRVLLISGYDQSEPNGHFACMAKPFTPGQLIRRVRELLDA